MSDQLTTDLESLKISRNRGDSRQRRDDEAPRGGALRRLLVWILVLGALGAAVFFGYPSIEARLFKPEVRVSEVSVISPAQAATTLTATGYVIPQVISKVAPQTMARVAKVHVREGETVVRDQVLVELDGGNQRSQVSAARARALAAQARLATARANLAEVQNQVERERGLVETGATARSTLQDLESRAGSLNAAVEAAGAEMRAAQAEIEVLRVGVDQLTVNAPIDGTILDKPPELGEMVDPEEVMLEIADLRSLVVEVDVPEVRLGTVTAGSPCEIVLDAFPGRRYRGATLEIGRRVNRSKATVPVKVRFVDANEGVLPDMSARVSFLASELTPEQLRAREKVVVPRAALTTRGGRNAVFVVEDGAVRVRFVELGQRIGDDVEILDGPSPGEQVVLDPPSTLTDGKRVKEATN